jgi:hypothetical protein
VFTLDSIHHLQKSLAVLGKGILDNIYICMCVHVCGPHLHAYMTTSVYAAQHSLMMEGGHMCVCVCVCVRERERERERWSLTC